MGTTQIIATDGFGKKAETQGQIVAASIELDSGSGYYFLSGALNAGFTEGPYGFVNLEVDWICTVTPDELAGA